MEEVLDKLGEHNSKENSKKEASEEAAKLLAGSGHNSKENSKTTKWFKLLWKHNPA